MKRKLKSNKINTIIIIMKAKRTSRRAKRTKRVRIPMRTSKTRIIRERVMELKRV